MAVGELEWVQDHYNLQKKLRFCNKKKCKYLPKSLHVTPYAAAHGSLVTTVCLLLIPNQHTFQM